MNKENRLWKQRAKSFWLVWGDKNSKYFHSRGTQRHRRNKISGFFNSSNLWCTNTEDVAAVLTGFNQNLFKVSTRDQCYCQCWYECTAFSRLHGMGSSSSLEANCSFEGSMPLLFYQNYWSLVGSDVTQSILSSLNIASLPHPLNHTFLTLIPKVKISKRVGGYKPISLCNFLYKFFSKVLANRLKEFCHLLFQSTRMLSPRIIWSQITFL